MMKSGYVVLNDYDKTRISDKEQGEKVRAALMSHICRVIANAIIPEKAQVNIPETNTNITIDFEDRDENKYHVLICTINHLVNRNKILMRQNSIILPFDKSMDKYGTVYLSIGSEEANNHKVEAIIDGFISRFVQELNNTDNYTILSYSDTFKFVPAIKEVSYETSTAI